MFGFIKKILSTKQARDERKYQPLIREINRYAVDYQQLSHDDLRK